MSRNLNTTDEKRRLVVDEEFSVWMSRPTPEECQALQSNIIRDGCREPLTLWGNVIIDGHTRYHICNDNGIPFSTVQIDLAKLRDEYGGLDNRSLVKLWIIDNQFGRRNCNNFQRCEMAVAREELIPGRPKGANQYTEDCQNSDNPPTDRKKVAADMAGVSHDTFARVKSIIKAHSDGVIDDKVMSKLRSAQISINSGKILVTRSKRDRDATQRRNEALASGVAEKHVRIGDFRDVLSDIPDGSVDLAFTDPPYDEPSVPLYSHLGKLAKRILRENGSLITYVGQHSLPTVVNLIIDAGLSWFWEGILEIDEPALLRHKGLKVEHKSLLWFVNGTNRLNTEVFVGTRIASPKEKCTHPWQQSVADAMHFILPLTPPGGIIVDPFCGGGTTAVACVRSNRNFVTCEIDPGSAALAEQRIQAEIDGRSIDSDPRSPTDPSKCTHVGRAEVLNYDARRVS